MIIIIIIIILIIISDATGCYDRIIPALQTIHTRRLGLAKNMARVMASSLHKSERYISTKHGVSKEYFKSTNDTPLFGVGQGSGAGPAVRLAHLVVMLNAFGDKCTGICSNNPDGSIR